MITTVEAKRGSVGQRTSNQTHRGAGFGSIPLSAWVCLLSLVKWGYGRQVCKTVGNDGEGLGTVSRLEVEQTLSAMAEVVIPSFGVLCSEELSAAPHLDPGKSKRTEPTLEGSLLYSRLGHSGCEHFGSREATASNPLAFV